MNPKKAKKRLIDWGLTQTKLAQILGIPRNRVNDAIMGRREGRKYQFPIAKFLEIKE